MLNICLRRFPQTRAIWFAEEPDVGAVITSSGWKNAVEWNQVDFLQAARQPRGKPDRFTTVFPFDTLLTDLTVDEDTLWKAVAPRARTQINRTGRDSRVEIVRPTADPGYRFRRDVTAFLRRKNLGVPTRSAYDEYLRQGVMSCCLVDGQVAVIHVNVVDPDVGRARLLWSARTERELAVNTADLNRLLFWNDLLHLRDDVGLQTYDWGGIGLTDPALAGIDRFKRQFGGRLVTEWNVTWRSPLYARLRPLPRAARRLAHRVLQRA